MYKSKTSSRHEYSKGSEKSSGRYVIGTGLIDEEEFKFGNSFQQHHIF
jgi:hypothetical protein